MKNIYIVTILFFICTNIKSIPFQKNIYVSIPAQIKLVKFIAGNDVNIKTFLPEKRNREAMDIR